MIFIAGLVRGFSGFGTGMIVAPAVSAIYSPQTALIVIFIIDTLPALPVVYPETKRCDWKELKWITLGLIAFLPLGLMFIKFGDVTIARWLIAYVIFIAVILLWSGWKYKGPQGKLPSLAIGSLSGFLGGAAALPGPPAIIYWMASNLSTIIIRANTMVFLFLADVLIGVGLIIANMITFDGLIKGVLSAPFYLLGLIIGTTLFGFASEATYKRVAFMIIVVSALISMPILDGYIRN